MGVPSLIMTFEPHPEEYFSRVSYGTRLTPLREKLDLLHHFAIDRVLCVQFNQSFADMSAETFVTKVLHQELGAKHVVIGDDFCFGRGRQGNFDLLQNN